MGKLLKSPHLFALWWFIKAPKKIMLVVKRLLQILNNQLSFTVNLRLIFTPLFGDYTFIGRFIGFGVRIFEIFFGVVIIAFFTSLYVLLPLAWILLPAILLYKYGIVTILVLGIIYCTWAFLNRGSPEKKINECTGEPGDFIKSFRPHARDILSLIAKNTKIGTENLTKSPKIQNLLLRLELLNKGFEEKLQGLPNQNETELTKASFTFAKEAGALYVGEISVFMGLLRSIPNLENFLSTFNTKLSVVEAGTKWMIAERDRRNHIYPWQEEFQGMILGGFGKGMTGRVTPLLDSISEDLTRQALKSGFEKNAVRADSINKLAELLSARTENILVVGEPGSGKTSLVRGMAYQIMRGTSHKSLWNKRIVSISLGGVLSDTSSVGEIASKLKFAIKEAKASGDVILFIDEIHSLVAGSGKGSPEVSAIFNLLEPELSTGTIQFIGATSSQNYRKYIEPNGAFSRLFHVFELPEATYEETFKILQFVVRELETKKKIMVTYVALDRCIELSKKLIHERVLPDKAILILDRASTYVEGKTNMVDSKVVAEVTAEITHVPSATVTDDEAQKLLTIESELKKTVIGQDHALKQISSALKRARAGVRNENKPIASFLFVGTTGVGKTQTAKTLAKVYFGDAKAVIRLDMSEYQQVDSIARLIGNPDGSSRGILTDAVRSRPFALILLDELEKAHANILLTFLQVLDDGRLTDSSGTTVDFTNTIIIATSNVGTRSIQQVFEENGDLERMTQVAMEDVRTNFAPEFLNRFTGVIVFNPLTLDNVKEITKLMLAGVAKSAEEKSIKVSFENELIDELVKRGFSKEWGARPLARVIEDSVETYLAEKILARQLLSGAEISLGLEVFNS